MLKLILSTGFYITFIIYILLGIYGLSLNKDDITNRIFALLCLSFSIWAVTFTFSISASSYEHAIFWRRISALGWGVTYSVIVHFIIVLTGMTAILNKKSVYLAIYIPSLINIIVFGPFTKKAVEQYQLVHTQAGWGHIPLSNFWDFYFNFYYLTFSLIAFILLGRWYLKSDDTIIKRNAIYLTISFAIALVLGSLTDIVANRYLPFILPSLAPIIILIPAFTIIFIIQKYGFLVPKETLKTAEEGIILSYNKRKNLFKSITLILFTVSITNTILILLHPENFTVGIFFSLSIAIVATIIYLIPVYTHTLKQQDYILLVMLNITLVLIMQFYYDDYMSNIIWPIPLLFIILTIIFNSKRVFIMTALTTIIMGIITWIRLPELTVQILPIVHFSRLSFYLIVLGTTIYIQRIYIYRLKENEKQVLFQKLISSISSDFTNIAASNFDEKITEMLKESCLFLGSDRSYLGVYDQNKKKINFTHEWIKEGLYPIIKGSDTSNTEIFPWSSSQLSKNKIVFISSINELPAEAASEKTIMLIENIKSMIYLPIVTGDLVVGFIGFDQIRTKKDWHFQDRDLLRVLANIIAEAFKKIEIENRLNYLAYYDELTGLPNRVLFSNRLEQEIPKAIREDKKIGVMLLDLDGFKDVNDIFGHDWGDYLLIEVAKRLRGCIRRYDTTARFGGDEFLIMTPAINEISELEAVANNILNTFLHPIIVNKNEFFISVSIGISVFPWDGTTMNHLVKNADMAMYHAKNNGKGQYQFCTNNMKEQVFKTMTLTNFLYRALEKEELSLNYQPQICIKTGEIIGMEVLLRWNHPEIGSIPPNVFIPIAEQTGLINEIGEWVLRTACLQNKQWQNMGYKPIQIAVNLSVEQFRSKNIYTTIKKCLDESQLEPRYLELEITESIAMKESMNIIQDLHKIKALGVAIAIDDFGTEYSSLSRLKNLPIDRLKMDIKFIRGIAVNKKDESIVTVIIHLAKSLGLKVIAEGVETDVQLNFLKQEDCDEVQGYYYYKPLSKEDMDTLIMDL